MKERIRFYDERVRECVERLNTELDAGSLDDATWRQAKLLYIGLLVDHKRPELAETFFNSVVTRVLRRTYVHNSFAFVRAAISTEYIESDPPNYRSYYPAETSLRETLVDVFRDCGWSPPFADLERDVDFVLQALLDHLGGEWPVREPNFQLQVLGSAFYRNKAAHVIGKLVNGSAETPIVVPVLHDADGRLVSTRRSSTRSRSRCSSPFHGPTSWRTWTCLPATSSSCSRCCRRRRGRSSTPPSASRSRGRRSSTATCCTTCNIRRTSSCRRPAPPASSCRSSPSRPIRTCSK